MLNEDFQVHNTLNPKIWDSAGHLLPEVRAKIVEIVKEFEKELQVPLKLSDIQIVGSNASYDYTETSDLDVHLIANFELVSNDTALVQTLYQFEKSKFNDNHDISIRGINIELYVQDVDSGIESNGIYSILDNKWVKEPKPINSATKKNVDKELQAWKTHITKIIVEHDLEQIENAINTLHLIRHNALAAEGQYSKGNQLFKEIRSLGLLDRLKEERVKLIDKKLTLEGYKESCSNGELINILEE